MTHHDLIIGWLNDAHVMELGIVQVLERHAASAAEYPQVQAGIQKHLEQTRQHAELVKGCVERLGGDEQMMADQVCHSIPPLTNAMLAKKTRGGHIRHMRTQLSDGHALPWNL
jgi:ferritin-like metal-binding protein YciE